jgi:RHS repeat-associated protein
MLDKSIKEITYNFLNLPTNVLIAPVSGTSTAVQHVYRADGIKVFKKSTKGTAITTTDYLDGFHYEHSSLQPTAPDLKFVSTAEGYFSFENNKYIYQYKDQVGNVRVSFYKDASGNAVIDKTTDYYPFGLEHQNGVNPSITPSYRYGFQKQEKQEETGWSSFKWRNYDPSIGRFFNVDPLSEDYAYQSHYNFSENRVIDNVEIEGLEGEDFRFRMVMKSKGGVQARSEKEDQEAHSATFMGVIKTMTPIEEIYTLVTGRDLDGNKASREEAGQLLALSLVPPIKGEAKVAATVAKAEAKAAAKAAKAEANIVSKKPYSKNRPSYAKGQVETVWESAKKKNGKVYDPNTGEELKWDKSKKPRQWDMGHKPGHEYRKLHKKYMNGKITKEEFLKEYRNPKNYQPESKSANRSGKYEQR